MKCFRNILLLAVLALFTGCASRRPNLIACTSGSPTRLDFRKVSLMPSPGLGPREQTLQRDLVAELQRRGIATVPRTESDFTLAIGFEVHSETDVYTSSRPLNPIGYPGIGPPTLSGGMIYREKIQVMEEIKEREIRTEGIRIRLYTTRELRQGHFQAAWEGYLEAGLRLRPEHQPELLRILLDHMGQDFVGRVKTP